MEILKKMIIIAFIITILIVIITIFYFQYFATKRLIISTTTSFYDTGLLNIIEKEFEAKYKIDINLIAVGTGMAIQHAKNGDADIIIVHSPTLEEELLKEGIGTCRKIIAYNFFVIVGPENDPAKINGTNPIEALKRIANYGKNQRNKIWVSRGDESGTHIKEKILWSMAGYDPIELSKEQWYVNKGSSMGATLMMANEFSAYTLSDIGTYLKYYKDGLINLKPFIIKEKELLNVYSVIAIKKKNQIDKDAINFIKFLISEEGQEIIENYGKEDYGQNLFYSAIKTLKEEPFSQISQWIKDYAFFNGSECPKEYRNGYSELYTTE